jgi:hypothetical protein
MRKSTFGLVLLCMSCTTTMQSFQKTGLKKAAFELGCPEADLKLFPIKETTPLGDPEGIVGVEGCGRKATFINSVSGWVTNTATP